MAQAYQKVTRKEVLEIFQPRYNVGPQNVLPVIRQDNDQPEWAAMRWGLVPSWAGDASIGNKLFNARSETVRDKPSFRDAFRRRRCLIPVDGFYEWKKLDPKNRQPYHIHPPDGGFFTLGGLWDRWRNPVTGERLESFTVITTTPNRLMAGLHDRMPVIIVQDDNDRWLSEDDPEAVGPLLEPVPSDFLVADPVSRVVNNIRNDGPECLKPEGVRGGLF